MKLNALFYGGTPEEVLLVVKLLKAVHATIVSPFLADCQQQPGTRRHSVLEKTENVEGVILDGWSCSWSWKWRSRVDNISGHSTLIEYADGLEEGMQHGLVLCVAPLIKCFCEDHLESKVVSCPVPSPRISVQD